MLTRRLWIAVLGVLGLVGTSVTATQMIGWSGDRDLVERIKRYRGTGSAADGLHTLSQPTIDDTDYGLMAADNSSARANNRSLSRDQVIEYRWFALKKGSELSKKNFGNSHGSSDDGGKTWYTETALLDIPRLQFQAPPEEVLWHRRRVDELRSQNVPQSDRVTMMDAERKEKPWSAPR